MVDLPDETQYEMVDEEEEDSSAESSQEEATVEQTVIDARLK